MRNFRGEPVFLSTGWPRSYHKYILQIMQPAQYRCAKLQYRFAVTAGSPSSTYVRFLLMFKNEIPLDLKLSIWLTKTVQKRYKKHLLCTYSLAASLYWSMQSTGVITRICAGCIMDGITGSNPGLSWHIQPNFIFSDKCAHLILIAWPTIVIFRSHVMHFFNNKIVLKYLPFFINIS